VATGVGFLHLADGPPHFPVILAPATVRVADVYADANGVRWRACQALR
jgi:hypothetical protein